jgi:flavin reductase (DIM6/NTAB) family NADH-FMN oxidoreductase RutF
MADATRAACPTAAAVQASGETGMNIRARKETLRMLSNGVYILTAHSGDRYGGATVTWISQASFKPPLVMAAVRKESNVFRCLEESGIAAIHILASNQCDVAQRFFTPTVVQDGRMNGEPFRLSSRALPILDSAPAYVECGVRRIVDGIGDHAIVLLEVLEAESRGPVHPLTVAESPWQYGG